MFAGHQHAARGGTDGIAGIMLGKAHPFGSQSIDVGGTDLGLAEAAHVGVAQVVGKNEYDIRYTPLFC